MASQKQKNNDVTASQASSLPADKIDIQRPQMTKEQFEKELACARCLGLIRAIKKEGIFTEEEYLKARRAILEEYKGTAMALVAEFSE